MTAITPIIIGAGPAGLTAGYTLSKEGLSPLILEQSPLLGGISRTINYKGYYFDLGGHRFFTKYSEVEDMWREILGDDLLVRPRLSRIYYNQKFYNYPLKATNALKNLGLRESTRCMASYAVARLKERGNEENFEQWVSNRFGKRLFNIFFKTYTEKVWGIPTDQIGADWAAQRIKNMELSTAVKGALLGPLKNLVPSNGEVVSSLIEEFLYPKTGPGLMYEVMAEKMTALGGKLNREEKVYKLDHDGKRVLRLHTRTRSGDESTYEGDQFLSTMPLTSLVSAMGAPQEILDAANSLKYRHLLTIDLIIDHPDLFPDNWIYVHDQNLQLGRIQNFKNWSPFMVPDQSKTSLGLEYFCSDDDDIWKMSTEELVELGKREMEKTGLLKGEVIDGTAVWVPKAYPVYMHGYEAHLKKVTDWVRSFENLHPMGRYGMFKYNNADHSSFTAMLTVENILGRAKHNVWTVNTDTDYHEIRKE